MRRGHTLNAQLRSDRLNSLLRDKSALATLRINKPTGWVQYKARYKARTWVRARMDLLHGHLRVQLPARQSGAAHIGNMRTVHVKAVAAPEREQGASGQAQAGKGLNKYSRHITQPKVQGGSQAMLYATGLTEEDMNKPQASCWLSQTRAECLIGYCTCGKTGSMQHC